MGNARQDIVVDLEGYLLELCRYVVLNPVRTGRQAYGDQVESTA